MQLRGVVRDDPIAQQRDIALLPDQAPGRQKGVGLDDLAVRRVTFGDLADGGVPHRAGARHHPFGFGRRLPGGGQVAPLIEREALALQRLHGQIGAARRAVQAADRQIQLAVSQPGEQAFRAVFHHRHPGMRVAAVEAFEHLGQVAQQRIDAHPHPQALLAAGAHAAQLVKRAEQLIGGGVYPPVKQLADRRQAHAAVAALQQPRADGHFQLFEHPAERRLRDGQFFRGIVQTSAVNDVFEHRQMSQFRHGFHGGSPWK